MRIILRLAETFGAPALIDVTRAHLDCCIHTGPASVAVAERLRDLWRALRRADDAERHFDRPRTLGRARVRRAYRRGKPPPGRRLHGDGRRAHLHLRALSRRCACAGEQIAWAEFHAVAFANTCARRADAEVPGLSRPLHRAHPAARRSRAATRRRVVRHEPCCGGSGRKLRRFLLPAARLPSPACSRRTTSRPSRASRVRSPQRDDLKAFAAAFATTSAAPMFHIVGVTPEAPSLEPLQRRNASASPSRGRISGRPGAGSIPPRRKRSASSPSAIRIPPSRS